jgi:uncharacterized iron-regulated membrane protein
MTSEDAYFVGHAGERPRLPVYRVILRDEESTRYYLDPVSAEIEAKMDRNSRRYRWLHRGLHCLNVLPAIRSRPAWDVLMLVLLSGVLGVCVTGTCLGLERLIGSLRRPPRDIPVTSLDRPPINSRWRRRFRRPRGWSRH